MTRMFDKAIETVRALPDAEQDEAAEMLLSVAARYAAVVQLDDATRVAIREGRAEARRGELVSDADMDAFFTRHGVTPTKA